MEPEVEAAPIELPEEPAPLAEEPVEEAEELFDEEPPFVVLPDEELPLSELPDEEPPLAELFFDEDTPLVDVPETGDGAGMWTAMFYVSAAGLLCLFVWERRRSREN